MIANKTQPAPIKFWVQTAQGRVALTYQQVFSAGHKLWLKGRYFESAQVFQHLIAVTDRGPRAHILLAHCKAMTGNYSECSRILAEALESEQYGNAASDLHTAFVMWKCSLFVDAKDELQKVVTTQMNLPTPCLLLADLLMSSGNREKPAWLLRQAISRDRPDGAIAAIARRELPIALKMAANPAARKSSKLVVRLGGTVQ